MAQKPKYSILVAAYTFRCPSCDETVRRGENYVETDEWRICTKCGLPERRLRPVNAKITDAKVIIT